MADPHVPGQVGAVGPPSAISGRLAVDASPVGPSPSIAAPEQTAAQTRGSWRCNFFTQGAFA
eukprot:3647904-Pyramimonas_sp.AAC.1